MKLLYVIVGVAILASIAFIAWRTFRSDQSAPEVFYSEGDPSNSDHAGGNPYLDLRSMAIEVHPEQVGAENETIEPRAYGIIMDWSSTNGTATFVSFLSGDASMYTSSGGGIIGGAGDEKVKSAAIRFVETAQKFVPLMERSDNTDIPPADNVKFMILTTQGRYIAEEKREDFDNESSRLTELFNEANNLISDLRRIDENPTDHF